MAFTSLRGLIAMIPVIIPSGVYSSTIMESAERGSGLKNPLEALVRISGSLVWRLMRKTLETPV